MTTDILTAASPSTTLILSFISSALSAVLLSPIDTARTFLIVTPLTHGPRSLLRAIRLLPPPSYLIPPHLVPITVLHSSLPTLLNTGTPLFLKSYFSIDPVLNPSAWGLFTFVASGLELGIRFPLETVLRRAQIATFTSPALRQKSLLVTNSNTSSPQSSTGSQIEAPGVETIVPAPQTYRGIAGTMWSIVYEEGVSPSPSETERAYELLKKPVPKGQQRRRQGQGIQGLYRGWKIGIWGLAGIWGADALGAVFGVGEDDCVTAPGSGIGKTGSVRPF
jgi:mitochondrial fusion and transport protein UGO1